jgi:hypothetical protein
VQTIPPSNRTRGVKEFTDEYRVDGRWLVPNRHICGLQHADRGDSHDQKCLNRWLQLFDLVKLSLP